MKKSSEIENPAFMAILNITTDIVTSFRNDILIHDKDMINKFPTSRFFYFFRESGTHLIPFKEISCIEQDQIELSNLVQQLWEANSHHYLWDGQSLKQLTHETLEEIIMESEILHIQI